MATARRVTPGLPPRGEVLKRGLDEAGSFKAVPVPRDPVQRSRARTQLTRNITNIYRDAPAKTQQQGREWYPKAHDEAVAVGRKVGGDTRTGAGIVAAISPSMSWENNIPAAHQMAHVPDHLLHGMAEANETQKAYASIISEHERAAGKRAGVDRIPGAAPAHLYAAHEEARAAHMHARSFLSGTPLNNQSTDNILKAHAIRAGADPTSVLPMRQKTGHFFTNVNDPSDTRAVTVDTHAHDAARMTKLPFKTPRGLSAVGRYDHFADAYRNATPRVGAAAAHEVQATVWQHWKDRYGNDTSGSAPKQPVDHELEGRDRTSQEYGIAARSAATLRKRGRPDVDPDARAAGW